MKVYLEASLNGEKPKRIKLMGNAIIGRSTECNLRIASRAVSRKHCSIEVAPAGVSVMDLGSSNGTVVNDSKLKTNSRQSLMDGDKLVVGPMNFVLRIEQLLQQPTKPDGQVDVTQPMKALVPEDLAATTVETEDRDLKDFTADVDDDEFELTTEEDDDGIEEARSPVAKVADLAKTLIDEDDDDPLELGFDDDDEPKSGVGKLAAGAAGLAAGAAALGATFIDNDIADAAEAVETVEADDLVESAKDKVDDLAATFVNDDNDSSDSDQADDLGATLVSDSSDAFEFDLGDDDDEEQPTVELKESAEATVAADQDDEHDDAFGILVEPEEDDEPTEDLAATFVEPEASEQTDGDDPILTVEDDEDEEDGAFGIFEEPEDEPTADLTKTVVEEETAELAVEVDDDEFGIFTEEDDEPQASDDLAATVVDSPEPESPSVDATDEDDEDDAFGFLDEPDTADETLGSKAKDLAATVVGSDDDPFSDDPAEDGKSATDLLAAGAMATTIAGSVAASIVGLAGDKDTTEDAAESDNGFGDGLLSSNETVEQQASDDDGDEFSVGLLGQDKDDEAETEPETADEVAQLTQTEDVPDQDMSADLIEDDAVEVEDISAEAEVEVEEVAEMEEVAFVDESETETDLVVEEPLVDEADELAAESEDELAVEEDAVEEPVDLVDDESAEILRVADADVDEAVTLDGEPAEVEAELDDEHTVDVIDEDIEVEAEIEDAVEVDELVEEIDAVDELEDETAELIEADIDEDGDSPVAPDSDDPANNEGEGTAAGAILGSILGAVGGAGAVAASMLGMEEKERTLTDSDSTYEAESLVAETTQDIGDAVAEHIEPAEEIEAGNTTAGSIIGSVLGAVGGAGAAAASIITREEEVVEAEEDVEDVAEAVADDDFDDDGFAAAFLDDGDEEDDQAIAVEDAIEVEDDEEIAEAMIDDDDDDDLAQALVVDDDDDIAEALLDDDALEVEEAVAIDDDEFVDADEIVEAVEEEELVSGFDLDDETDGAEIEVAEAIDEDDDNFGPPPAFDLDDSAAEPPSTPIDNFVPSSGSVADIVGPVLGAGAAFAAKKVMDGKADAAEVVAEAVPDIDNLPEPPSADIAFDEDEGGLIEVEVDELDDQHVAFADDDDDGADFIAAMVADDEDDDDTPVALADPETGSDDFDELSFEDPVAEAAIVDDAIDVDEDEDDDAVGLEADAPKKKRGGLFSLFGLLGGKKKKAAKEDAELDVDDEVQDIDEDDDAIEMAEAVDDEAIDFESDDTDDMFMEVSDDDADVAQIMDADVDEAVAEVDEFSETVIAESIPEVEEVAEAVEEGGVDLLTVPDAEVDDDLASDALDAFADFADDSPDVDVDTSAVPMPSEESEDDAFAYLLGDDDGDSDGGAPSDLSDFLKEFED